MTPSPHHDLEAKIIRTADAVAADCTALLSSPQIHAAMRRTADLQRMLVKLMAMQG